MRSTIAEITNCTGCSLYQNQLPLLDSTCLKADVFWVGLSAKLILVDSDPRPLGCDTLSGQIVRSVEVLFSNLHFYATNLVKCVPLGDNGSLRYPVRAEIAACLDNLLVEITELQPRLIFLLGKIVSRKVLSEIQGEVVTVALSSGYCYEVYGSKFGVLVPIHHPAYIGVYKKKDLVLYTAALAEIIRKYCCG